MRKLILLVTCLIPLNLYAGGGTVGNGGDAFASEFVLTARMTANILKKKDLSKIINFELNKFAGAIEVTEVLTEKTLILNGNEVDAINYPSLKLIKVSRTRWQDLRDEKLTISRFNLVIHEYLGIIGSDDSKYAISNELIKLMGVSDFSPDNWWNPMNPTNNISVNVIKPGESCSIADGGIYFTLSKEVEDIIYETCKGYKVQVSKTSGMGGNSSGMVGRYHTFKVTVLAPSGQAVGLIQYTPEWGQCLVSSDKYCSQSGTFEIGEVHFSFGLVQ